MGLVIPYYDWSWNLAYFLIQANFFSNSRGRDSCPHPILDHKNWRNGFTVLVFIDKRPIGRWRTFELRNSRPWTPARSKTKFYVKQQTWNFYFQWVQMYNVCKPTQLCGRVSLETEIIKSSGTSYEGDSAVRRNT